MNDSIIPTGSGPQSPDQGNKISIFAGVLTEDHIEKQITLLKNTFPKLKKEWFAILYDFLKEDKFTNERLTAAVRECIRTCVYPEPAMAEILSFDRKIELFYYEDMMKKLSENGIRIWDHYTNIEIDGKSCWCSNSDYDKYKFKKFIPIPFGTKGSILGFE